MAMVTLDETTSEKLKALRKPFPPECVRLKPEYVGDYELDTSTGQTFIPDENYQLCPLCNKVHPLPAKHFKYVGHAFVTERLNEVDPCWTWTPMGLDADGLPIVKNGELWGYLTVCGITHIGVGDAEGRTDFNAIKEMIGDSIRNAAMRFGCGLECWQHLPNEDDLFVDLPFPKTNDAVRSCVSKSEEITSQGVQDASETTDSEASYVDINYGTTKAQRVLGERLASIQEHGCNASEAIEMIDAEYGRPYYNLNKLEVDSALELLSASYPSFEVDEVIPV